MQAPLLTTLVRHKTHRIDGLPDVEKALSIWEHQRNAARADCSAVWAAGHLRSLDGGWFVGVFVAGLPTAFVDQAIWAFAAGIVLAGAVNTWGIPGIRLEARASEAALQRFPRLMPP